MVQDFEYLVEGDFPYVEPPMEPSPYSGPSVVNLEGLPTIDFPEETAIRDAPPGVYTSVPSSDKPPKGYKTVYYVDSFGKTQFKFEKITDKDFSTPYKEELIPIIEWLETKKEELQEWSKDPLPEGEIGGASRRVLEAVLSYFDVPASDFGKWISVLPRMIASGFLAGLRDNAGLYRAVLPEILGLDVLAVTMGEPRRVKPGPVPLTVSTIPHLPWEEKWAPVTEQQMRNELNLIRERLRKDKGLQLFNDLDITITQFLSGTVGTGAVIWAGAKKVGAMVTAAFIAWYLRGKKASMVADPIVEELKGLKDELSELKDLLNDLSLVSPSPPFISSVPPPPSEVVELIPGSTPAPGIKDVPPSIPQIIDYSRRDPYLLRAPVAAASTLLGFGTSPTLLSSGGGGGGSGRPLAIPQAPGYCRMVALRVLMDEDVLIPPECTLFVNWAVSNLSIDTSLDVKNPRRGLLKEKSANGLYKRRHVQSSSSP